MAIKIQKKIKTKANKILKYNIDENKVSEFLRKNGDNKRIDLHGFRLSEAMLIVKKKIEMMKKIIKENDLQNGLGLSIITGQGIHSPGHIPILRPNILHWLKRQKYQVDESDPGKLYVIIK
jgi:DNA-nicking Smr family endonuclease